MPMRTVSVRTRQGRPRRCSSRPRAPCTRNVLPQKFSFRFDGVGPLNEEDDPATSVPDIDRQCVECRLVVREHPVHLQSELGNSHRKSIVVGRPPRRMANSHGRVRHPLLHQTDHRPSSPIRCQQPSCRSAQQRFSVPPREVSNLSPARGNFHEVPSPAASSQPHKNHPGSATNRSTTKVKFALARLKSPTETDKPSLLVQTGEL